MALLRRVLYWMAAVWAGAGLAVAVVPRWILVTLFDQVPAPDYAYVRTTGLMSIGLAAMMVLVAQRLEELWWFSWAFALTGAALTTLTAVHALFGLPDGSGALLWWIFAFANGAFTVGLLAGMARAGTEKPFV